MALNTALTMTPTAPKVGLLSRFSQMSGGIMEGVLLTLVVVAPWTFGAVEPIFEFLLYGGVALLCILWGLRWLAEFRVSWKRCPVTLCLLGLFLFGLWQLAPIPSEVLRSIAPATARLYDQLLPAEMEVLPDGEPAPPAPFPPGRTLTVYPAATERQLDRLLALFLLFAVVRSNAASTSALRRLSIACLINGAALSLFALVQNFSSPPSQLYWTWMSPGAVYGPFICRNHFPFYTNMCLGLGVGLLLTCPSFRRSPELAAEEMTHAARRRRDRQRFTASGSEGFFARLTDIFQDQQALWACFGLGLIVGANIFSMSRGGLLALLLATTVGLLLWLRTAPRPPRLDAIIVVVSAGFGLLVWFGLAKMEARYATLFKNETAWDSRGLLWSGAVRAAADFPIWGSGFGTFAQVEPLYRAQPLVKDQEIVFDHAHNEYLEALVEGGVVRLALTLLMMVLVFRFGWRALKVHRTQPEGGLVLGALLALMTVAAHSVVDFGVHLPAIAALIAVIAAQLCALGKETGTAPAGAATDPPRSLRLGGVAPVLGTLLIGAAGLILVHEGWRVYLVQRSYVTALVLAAHSGVESEGAQLDLLEHCATLMPENAGVQQELALVYLESFNDNLARLEERHTVTQIADLTATLAGMAAAAPNGTFGRTDVVAWMTASGLNRLNAALERGLLQNEQLGAALLHYIQARDRCPLLPLPQMRIGLYASALAKAEPATAYFDRGKLLLPADAELWFDCGVQENAAGLRDRAYASWHRSLELSDRYLGQILQLASEHLSADGIIREILPDDPAILMAASSRLFPAGEAVEERRPFAEKAHAALAHLPEPQTGKEFRTRGLVLGAVGQWEPAVNAYRSALALQPDQTEWRFELAVLLYSHNELGDTRTELLTVLTQQPKHAAARKLLEAVSLERAKKL